MDVEVVGVCLFVIFLSFHPHEQSVGELAYWNILTRVVTPGSGGTREKGPQSLDCGELFTACLPLDYYIEISSICLSHYILGFVAAG